LLGSRLKHVGQAHRAVLGEHAGLAELRDVTFVWTFTLSNSVRRQFGISSVKRRSSEGVGFQTTDFASAGSTLDDGFAFAPLRNGSTDGVLVEGRMSVIRSVLADVEEL
jgi:hypothetical protein